MLRRAWCPRLFWGRGAGEGGSLPGIHPAARGEQLFPLPGRAELTRAGPEAPFTFLSSQGAGGRGGAAVVLAPPREGITGAGLLRPLRRLGIAAAAAAAGTRVGQAGSQLCTCGRREQEVDAARAPPRGACAVKVVGTARGWAAPVCGRWQRARPGSLARGELGAPARIGFAQGEERAGAGTGACARAAPGRLVALYSRRRGPRRAGLASGDLPWRCSSREESPPLASAWDADPAPAPGPACAPALGRCARCGRAQVWEPAGAAAWQGCCGLLFLYPSSRAVRAWISRGPGQVQSWL